MMSTPLAPKTFQIRLRQPFGIGSDSILLYQHANTRHEVLGWLEKMFPGLDLKPMLYRWSGGAVSSVGNSDPVAITDCDRFSSTKHVDGKLVRTPSNGEFRKSFDDVVDSYVSALRTIEAERVRCVDSFHSMSMSYRRQPVAWVYERLQELRNAAIRAELWQKTLGEEVDRVRPPLALDMPPVLHARAA